MRARDVTELFASAFPRLPDLERSLSRIHAKSCRLQEFLKALDGFELGLSVVEGMKTAGPFASLRLSSITAAFPAEMAATLERFRASFDSALAATEGTILPLPGAEPSYDQAVAAVTEIETKLNEYLAEQRKILKCVDSLGSGRSA